MPGKHVRFSEDVYIPCTPSPSYSVTSLPSSYGPMTPPPNTYLPMTGGVALNPILRACPTPPLMFNVTLPSENVRPAKHNAHMDQRVLLEPATIPAQASLVLTHPRLRAWKIRVAPAEGSGCAYVRVCDVLACIYASLRKQATASDYECLPSPAAQSEVTAAFVRRWMQMPDEKGQALEKSKGLKRVDFLGRTVTFAGLAPSQTSPGCLDLVML